MITTTVICDSCNQVQPHLKEQKIEIPKISTVFKIHTKRGGAIEADVALKFECVTGTNQNLTICEICVKKAIKQAVEKWKI